MIWWNNGVTSKQKANAKADLALVAPTNEELAWWATQKPRHRLPYVLTAASSWVVIPITWLVWGHHSARYGLVHAMWVGGFMGAVLSASLWGAAEPKKCASEIRGRRLRRALAASRDEAPSIQDYREPIRLLTRTDT